MGAELRLSRPWSWSGGRPGGCTGPPSDTQTRGSSWRLARDRQSSESWGRCTNVHCSREKSVVTDNWRDTAPHARMMRLNSRTFFWTTVELCTWIIWPIIILQFAAQRAHSPLCACTRPRSAAHLILTLETKLANFPGLGWIWVIVILSVLTEHHTVSVPLIGPDSRLEPSHWLTFAPRVALGSFTHLTPDSTTHNEDQSLRPRWCKNIPD